MLQTLAAGAIFSHAPSLAPVLHSSNTNVPNRMAQLLNIWLKSLTCLSAIFSTIVHPGLCWYLSSLTLPCYCPVQLAGRMRGGTMKGGQNVSQISTFNRTFLQNECGNHLWFKQLNCCTFKDLKTNILITTIEHLDQKIWTYHLYSGSVVRFSSITA